MFCAHPQAEANGVRTEHFRHIKEHFLYQAKELLQDLETNRLCVVLVPSPLRQNPYDKIRKVESKNPGWYSSLWWKYHRSERRKNGVIKDNSSFRRDLSIKALEHIVTEKDMPSKEKSHCHFSYHTVYRFLIKSRLISGYLAEVEGVHAFEVLSDNDVRLFFGLKPQEHNLADYC